MLETEKIGSKKLVMVSLLLLLSTNLIFSESIREHWIDYVNEYDRDDANHIGIAYNFWKHNSFERNFLGVWIYNSEFDEIELKYTEVTPEQAGKGPFFYIALGSFYKLFDTETKDLYLHATYLNSFLSLVFTTLFFTLVYKKFNLKISFFSTLLLIFIPFFEWMSIRTLPMMLFYVFSISALFFLEKKYSHYALFGVFTALSHLTHPFGILLGISYASFLLLKKEFKGFLILIGIWILVLTPWFLRNYYLFKNIGYGLYIPLSSTISNYLSFLPTVSLFPNDENFIASSSNFENLILNPFYILIGMYNNFEYLYRMEFLILFVSIFSILAYFNFKEIQSKINKKFLKIFFVFLILIISIFFVSFHIVSIQTPPWEGQLFYNIFAFLIIFGIPIIFVSLFYIKKKEFFIQPIPRFYSFVLILIIVNLIGYFYTAYTQHRIVPETRQLMLMIFLVIPISVMGLNSTLTLILTKLNDVNKTKSIFAKINYRKLNLKLIISLVLLFTISPVLYQMYVGIEYLSDYPFIRHESHSTKILNQFVNDNIPKDAVVLSNNPSTTSIRTGLESISLSPSSYSLQQKSNLITHFNASYVIFNDISNYKTKNLDELYKIQNLVYPKYAFNQIFSGNGTSVYQIDLLSDIYIQNKVENIKKSDDFDMYYMSFDGIYDYYFTEIDNARKLQKENEIKLLSNSFENFSSALNNFVIESSNNTKIKITKKNIDAILESMNESEYYIDLTIGKYQQVGLLDKASILIKEKNSLHELLIEENTKIIEITNTKINELFSETKDHESLEKYKELKSFMENEITQLESSGHNDFANVIRQNLISFMHDEGEVLFKLQRLNNAERVYLDLTTINKFDGIAWLQLGKIYHANGKFSQAIHAYEMADRFLDDESIIIRNTIQELKKLI